MKKNFKSIWKSQEEKINNNKNHVPKARTFVITEGRQARSVPILKTSIDIGGERTTITIEFQLEREVKRGQSKRKERKKKQVIRINRGTKMRFRGNLGWTVDDETLGSRFELITFLDSVTNNRTDDLLIGR